MDPSAINAIVWIVWLTVLGSVFGSFFNVVVYRLPEGMSLSVPGSHCPKCKHPVRWHDNIPVLSWFLLRGRCRDCRAPFSIRYPIVEAVTAAIFGILAAVEYVSGGANLPLQTVQTPGGLVEVHLDSTQMYLVYGYHVTLLSTLLCAAMIEFDGKRLPRSLFYPAAAIGLVVPIVWPFVHPVAAWPGLENLGGGIAAGLIDGPLGLAAGVAMGFAGWFAWSKEHRRGAVILLGAVGLFLGWQAVVALGLATMAFALLLRVLGRGVALARRIPPTAGLGVGALLWIVFWAAIVSLGSSSG